MLSHVSGRWLAYLPWNWGTSCGARIALMIPGSKATGNVCVGVLKCMVYASTHSADEAVALACGRVESCRRHDVIPHPSRIWRRHRIVSCSNEQKLYNIGRRVVKYHKFKGVLNREPWIWSGEGGIHWAGYLGSAWRVVRASWRVGVIMSSAGFQYDEFADISLYICLMSQSCII